ncbi:MAG TPA: extracellular solute-binding protein [Candidatus Binatia bacterium]|jgi:iron(III) transport system substrate-binding protein
MFFTALLSSLLAISSPAQTQEQSKDWEKKWQATIQAAKNEGKLVYHSGNSSEPYFQEFQKKFPEIKLTQILTRGGAAAEQRLMAERRAGVYVADIVHLGAGSGSALAGAGALDPLEPYMILPEVLDQSKWFEGRHYFADKDGKYVFKYASNPGADISYNTKLVNPDNIKSYWDILDARWKGKIVTYDPGARGSRLFSYFYYNPELGPRYLRRLFGEMELTASRDRRQMTDWLAQGKFAIALRTAPDASTLDDARAQGLPVNWFTPGHFKEAVAISGGPAHVAVVNRAPHPNAARLFINWFLSREGQLMVQNIAAKHGDGVDSLRMDIPKDMIHRGYRREEKTKFFDMDAPAHANDDPVAKLINEAWRR